jgi:hypothetical protein
MSIECILVALYRHLNHSGIKLGLSLIISLTVITSPIVVVISPELIAASPYSMISDTVAPSSIGQVGSDFTTQAILLSSLTARPTITLSIPILSMTLSFSLPLQGQLRLSKSPSLLAPRYLPVLVSMKQKGYVQEHLASQGKR